MRFFIKRRTSNRRGASRTARSIMEMRSGKEREERFRIADKRVSVHSRWSILIENSVHPRGGKPVKISASARIKIVIIAQPLHRQSRIMEMQEHLIATPRYPRNYRKDAPTKNRVHVYAYTCARARAQSDFYISREQKVSSAGYLPFAYKSLRSAPQ